MKAIGNEEISDDFRRGMDDCINGVKHQNGSDEYNRGYGSQYEHDEIAENQSVMGWKL